MNLTLDRKAIIVIAGAALSIIAFIGSLIWSGSASTRLQEMRRAHAEMAAVGGELRELRARLQRLERKAAQAGDKSVMTSVEQVVGFLRIKGKLVSQKSVPSSARNEERAELSFEKLTLNEAVNLFYRLDAQPVLLIVRRISMSPSFDEPNLLMLDMTLSLMKPEEQ